MEAVGPKYRVFCGFVTSILQSVGILVMGAIAYFARDWWKLQLIIGAPVVIFVSFYWYWTVFRATLKYQSVI